MGFEGLFGEDAVGVGDFVARARRCLEEGITPMWVGGEVANFTRAASGHWYFVLRDEKAQVDCVMLAHENRRAAKMPKAGDKIFVFGQASIYLARGRFQVAVTQLKFEGVGDLYELFLRRKEKWQKLGWFDSERKKAVPFLPRRVGVVCSTAGAALFDVLRTLKLRLPNVRVVIYPAPAQGEDAAKKIGAAIAAADARGECDVLLVCRGGGGIEDLWAYNEEAVVAAIVAAAVPVVSGIGHEVDETLADYAADVRAATPTAAAAAAVPEAAQMNQQLDEAEKHLRHILQTVMRTHGERLRLLQRLISVPENYLRQKAQALAHIQATFKRQVTAAQQRQAERLNAAQARLRLPDLLPLQRETDELARRLRQAGARFLQRQEGELALRHNAATMLSPGRVLARGYSIVYDGQQRVVSDAALLKAKDPVRLVMYRGEVAATVERNDAGAGVFDEGDE